MALEDSNIGDKLFPQLAQQVGGRGSPSAPHISRPGESPFPPGAFSCAEPERGLGLDPNSRSDTPEMSVSQPATSGRDWGSEESSESRQVPSPVGH